MSTPIPLTRGDTWRLRLDQVEQLLAGDPAPVFDDVVLRAAIKRRATDDNAAALALGTSYAGGGIVVTSADPPEATWTVPPHVTAGALRGAYEVDWEVTRPGDAVPVGGTMTVEEGSSWIAFSAGVGALREGMLVEVDALEPGNAGLFKIVEVDVDGDRVRVEYTGWTTEALIPAAVVQGIVDTVVRRELAVDLDVTR